MAFYNQHTGTILYNSRPKDWDFVQVFKNNPVAVTIINGEYDFVDFGGKQYAIWLKGIPNVQLFVLPDAGHNSWLDHPELFKCDVNYGLQRALNY